MPDDSDNYGLNKDDGGMSDREVANLMTKIVLFGGPQTGFNTNPETNKRSCFIEVDGEKIVCLAQGGECRYNHKYYSPGLSDTKSWTTPIIDEDCPDQCCFKSLVCDNHPEKCEGSTTYYPEYNKFRGQYKRYCRNFEKYLGHGKQGKDKRIKELDEEIKRRHKKETKG